MNDAVYKAIRTLTAVHVIENVMDEAFTIPETMSNKIVLDAIRQKKSTDYVMKLFDSLRVSKNAVLDEPEEF